MLINLLIVGIAREIVNILAFCEVCKLKKVLRGTMKLESQSIRDKLTIGLLFIVELIYLGAIIAVLFTSAKLYAVIFLVYSIFIAITLPKKYNNDHIVNVIDSLISIMFIVLMIGRLQ